MRRLFGAISIRTVLPLIVLFITVGCSDGPAQPSVLLANDITVGTGATAVIGRVVTVHYTGWLFDASKPESKGTQFESSLGGTPFSFTLGVGRVIAGWDQGIPGMRVGGTRQLVIPPGLAYGSQGSGPIPGNRGLIFDVQLVAVQ
jgi:FKBP-type peptidyl-prolyl cis-trans isomerase FkpA